MNNAPPTSTIVIVDDDPDILTTRQDLLKRDDAHPSKGESWSSPKSPVWWSPRVRTILGYTEAEFPDVLSSRLSRLHPDDATRVLATLTDHIERRVPWDIAHRILEKSGEYCWIRGRGRALWGKTGRLIRVSGSLHRNTKGHRLEVTVRDRDKRWRQLTDQVQAVLWLADPLKTQILYVSPAYAAIWGRSCESRYAAPHTWIDAVHPEDRTGISTALSDKQASGEYNEDYRILRSDGTIRWMHEQASPIRDPSGRIYHIAGLAEDVTHARRWYPCHRPRTTA